jgi:flagellar protein FliO/FliZ
MTLHATGFVLRFLWIGAGLAFARQTASAADKATAHLPAAAEPAIAGLLQVVLGLLVILLLIGGTAWVLRRFTHLQSTAQGNMKILGGLPLGPRERVVLIQVGDKQLLVGVAPGRVQTLHVLEQPLVFSPDKQSSLGFAERLALALKQRTTRTGQAL